MRQALVLFGFALAALGQGACRASTAPEPVAAPPPVATAATAPSVARARSAAPTTSASAVVGTCRAEPATVYGQEPVTFVIDGPAAQQPLVAELVDEQGAALQRVTLAVPGVFHPEGLASGDFRLRLGPAAGCVVSINRELSRGSAGQTR